LSIVAGGGAIALSGVVRSVLSVIAVVGLAFTVGRRFVGWLYRTIDNSIGGEMAKITLLMILALLFGALTHALGIEAVLGAFLVGIVVGQVKRFDQQTRHTFETFAMGVFAPIFFAASGLRVNLTLLADPTVFGVGLIVLVVAILGKFIGAGLGARLSAMGWWESLSLGAAMNARGAIAIIVAAIGLSLGILTPEMYTIVLMVAIVTSLMTPPVLRYTLQHIPLSDEERERIATDQRRESSFVANLHRVLLPTRGGVNSQVAAHLLGLLVTDEEVEVTIMSVVPPDAAADSDAVGAASHDIDAMEQHLADLPIQQRRRFVQTATDDVVDSIVIEAKNGYDLVVLGAADVDASTAAPSLFGDVVSGVVQDVSPPVMVVSQRNAQAMTPHDLDLRRVLLPTTGTRSSEHTIEVAATIARRTGAQVDVLHVVERTARGISQLSTDTDEVGQDIVDRVCERLYAFGAGLVNGQVVRHLQPEKAIIRNARRSDADLIVMSASRRPVTQRAFFGHRAEAVLRRASCPVVVVS